ncbi:hypothetical protein AMS62_13205 [Bacillus sp. FJAT-18019]|nr:hypothetical protein AMS62_13205 [Bacillus sp. FJAT-18019]
MKPDDEARPTYEEDLFACRIGLLFMGKIDMKQGNLSPLDRMAYRFMLKRSKRTSIFFVAFSYGSFIIIMFISFKGSHDHY